MASPPPPPAPAPPIVSARRLWLARASWLLVAGPGFALMLLLIPINLRTVSYDWRFLTTYPLVASFLSRPAYAAYWLSLQYGVVVVCWLTAAFIAWRRADERIAWLAATVLVILPLGLGGNTETWAYYPERWRPVLLLISGVYTLVVGFMAFTAFIFLFPDGRFTPRWAAAPFALTMGTLVLLAARQALGRDLLFDLWLADLLAALLVGAGTLFYRYRRRSSPLERQQIKWVVATLTLWVASLPIGIALSALTERTAFEPLVLFVGLHVQLAALCGLPLSLAFSIFRYRLWAVDHLIRRTLLYSLLTAALGLLYLGSVLVLQQLTAPLVGAAGSQPAVIGSTLLIAGLAAPLNRRLQRAIDRRFYRRKYDTARTTAAFAATLRDEVELDHLTERLLAVVDETLGPASASLLIWPVRKP